MTFTYKRVFYLMQLPDALLNKGFIMEGSGIFDLLSSSKPRHGAVARHAGTTGSAVNYQYTIIIRIKNNNSSIVSNKNKNRISDIAKTLSYSIYSKLDWPIHLHH